MRTVKVVYKLEHTYDRHGFRVDKTFLFYVVDTQVDLLTCLGWWGRNLHLASYEKILSEYIGFAASITVNTDDFNNLMALMKVTRTIVSIDEGMLDY